MTSNQLYPKGKYGSLKIIRKGEEKRGVPDGRNLQQSSSPTA